MADVTINVSVIGEHLTLMNQPVLASGTVKAVQIQFSFDAVWDGYSKIALFWDESDEVYAWQVVNDLATVPHEVVASAGRLRFGVYGVKGTQRIVTEKVLYDIADGAYTSVYDESTEPTPGILDQIEAELTTQGTSIQTLQTQMATTRNDISDLGDSIDAIGENEEDLRALALGAYPTDSASGNPAEIPDGADGVPVKALSIAITPAQAGTGDPSPTNQRALSGWTGANIVTARKNICHLYDWTTVRYGVTLTYTKDKVTVNGLATQDFSVPYSEEVPQDGLFVLSPGTYTPSTDAENVVVEVVKININNSATVISRNQTFTIEQSATVFVRIWVRGSITYSNQEVTILLERGSEATDFEPFTGDSQAIAFPTAAGTVYGGTLDVTTGLLTVDRVTDTLNGSEDWTMHSSNDSGFVCSTAASMVKRSANAETAGVLSNLFRIVTNSSVRTPDASETGIPKSGGEATRLYFFLHFGFMADIDAWKSWLTTHPVQVSYLVANPITYQLNPAQVVTLLGYTQIYADCGDVTVTYRADPMLFISRGQTEDDMIADAPIASGKYFQIGNTLYRATATIATGETIAPGANCAVTSLAEALNLLNA